MRLCQLFQDMLNEPNIKRRRGTLLEVGGAAEELGVNDPSPREKKKEA